MTGKRKRYSAEFKAKVALEALWGERTVAELGAEYGVHPTMITAWKKPAVEGMAGVFSGKVEAADTVCEVEVEKLHAKIHQLMVERDFCRKPPVDEPGPEATDDRSAAPAALGPAAMPAGVDQPFRLLPPAGGRDALELGADAPARRAVPRDAAGHGSRQMARCLGRQGYTVGRKRVRRLMAKMGLSSIYQAPRTTVPHPDHRIYRYLVRDLVVDLPNQDRSRRYHLHPDAARLPVPRRGDGPGDPQGAELATIQHHEGRPPHRGSGRGARPLRRVRDVGVCDAAFGPTPTREIGSPRLALSRLSRPPASGSAWTGAADGWPTC